MRTRALLVLAAAVLAAAPVLADEPPRDPSFVHGANQVITGLVFEFPMTVIDGTLNGPPVAGTIVGAIAGVPKALQKIAAGFVEMGQGFDPWGSKRRE